IKTRNPEIAGLLLKQKARESEAGPSDGAPGLPDAGEPEAGQEEAPRSRKKGRKKAGETLARKAADGEADAPGSDPAEGAGFGAEPYEDAVLESVGAWEEDGSGADGGADAAPRRPAPKPEIKYDPYRVPALDEIFEEPPKQPLEFTEEELREQ